MARATKISGSTTERLKTGTRGCSPYPTGDGLSGGPEPGKPVAPVRSGRVGPSAGWSVRRRSFLEGPALRRTSWSDQVSTCLALQAEEVRFVPDSPVEGDGFELPVPLTEARDILVLVAKFKILSRS